MKPVFGYLRFSSLVQADGDSLDRQRDEIEKFCAAHGYRVLRYFKDEAVSGTTEAACREGFTEMMQLCGDATTRTVVVERSDRLARTLMVSEFACEEARKSGIQILTADSGTDLTNADDPTRVLIRQLLGALAEWNKNVTVKRLAAARRRIRLETGKCEGRKQFGSKDAEDAMTLALIIAMRQPGHEWTFRQIAVELDRRQRPTPERAIKWSHASVHQIYQREMKNIRRINKTILNPDDILS